MKLYKKRFIKERIRRQLEGRSETRDAILWDVQEAQRIARVKVQGSSRLIVAHFPQNWEKKPVWLKPGNAVKILHTGGIRGRVELIGHGNFIPTPIEGDTFPPLARGDDGVLTGCYVLAFDTPRMMVKVTAGTYRIGGVIYYLGGYGGEEGPIPMCDPPQMEMGDGIPMGTEGATGVEIDPAPTTPGNFRIDAIMAGTDYQVDYVKGQERASPAAPNVPPDHVLLGTVLLYYGMEHITNEDINRPFAVPVASYLVMNIADTVLAWGADPPPPYPEPETDVTVTVYNQYGYPQRPQTLYHISLGFLKGNGKIDGQSAPAVVTKATIGSSVTFVYSRNFNSGDKSPMLVGTLKNVDPELYCYGFIVLLDSNGVPMEYEIEG